MAYQSLYRRFRPRRFAEIKGQPHVVAALQGAVREGTVGHAYLLHGPRGTGKTTTARVLAKALNCADLGDDGEPCCVCESCVAIEEGRSFDLHELDAASNNRVENMRELLQKVNLGTPGRAKVYLLDEVHMLTSGAENALLKTLEEPPDHVTWVLATTEPHKVVETIRSRCQVFELRLLPGDEMAEHVRWVIAEAGLDIDPDDLDGVVDHVVAEGGGSVRDTLSALDRVVAAGGLVELDTSTETLIDALVARDVGAALAAVADALDRGRDPRTIGGDVLAGLRDAFLTAMGAPPRRLAERARRRATELAEAVPPAVLTRAVETLGTALVDMRQAPDPRVDLEVALVRLCGAGDDTAGASGKTVAALTARVEALEARLAALDASAEASGGPAGGGRDRSRRRGAGGSVPPPPTIPRRGGTDASADASEVQADPAGAAGADASADASTNASGGGTDASSVADASADASEVPADPVAVFEAALGGLPRRVSLWWSQGTVSGGADGRLVVSVPAARVAEKCEASRADVEAALAAAGHRLRIEIVVGGDAAGRPAPGVDDSAPAPGPAPRAAGAAPSAPGGGTVEPAGAGADDEIDLDDLVDAPDPTEETIARVTEAFPGSEVVAPGDEN